ncbi:MAG: type IV secretion system protein [Actinomycetota bacterium]|nr:type IV secretion system protein [Actinomycetota bacterium]
MVTATARRRWWGLVVFTGAVLGFVSLSGSDPGSASALPSPGDVLGVGKKAIGGLIGGASKVAGAVGGSVMKEVLEFLLGGIDATINLEVIKWLTHIDLNIGPSLSKLGGPMVVVGGFFLVVGLITSVGDSYREVVAGTDTAARVIGQAIFRVIGLALLMGSWFWLVPLAVEVANGMSAFVLDDAATKTALEKSFGAGKLTAIMASLNPLFALVLGLALVFTTLALVVAKFVIVIMFAILFLGGPVLIGFSALPRVGNAPLSMALRGTLTLMVIPLAWTVIFAAWAGITAGTIENIDKAGGVVRVLTGPALFLAGMVVLFALTKKLLSMASFGTPLSLPGGRMLRMATSMAVSRGIGAAAAGAGAGGAAGGAKGAATPAELAAQRSAGRHPGDADHKAALAAQAAAAGVPGSGGQAPTQPHRRPLNPAASPAENRQDAEQALGVARAADAELVGLRNGQFESLKRPLNEHERASRQQLAGRAEELRTTWGGAVPTQTLVATRESMPVALRSAVADRALHAKQSYADPAAQARSFEDSTLDHAAFRNLGPEQREGVANAIAAGPDSAWEAYKPDYQAFPGRSDVGQAGDQGGGEFRGYSTELFNHNASHSGHAERR